MIDTNTDEHKTLSAMAQKYFPTDRNNATDERN
jgi:hypothetical protein